MFKNIEKVSVNPLFFAVLALLVFIDSTSYMLVILCAALVHECGHLYALYRFHVPVRQLKFLPFGISITPSPSHVLGYGQELVVALAGPAVNLVLFLIPWLVSQVWTPPRLVALFALANATFFAANLVPMLPLDGGRALSAVLQRTLGPRRSGIVMGILTCILSLCTIAFGGYILYATGFNYSLAVIGIYLLVCFALSLKKPKPRAGPGGGTVTRAAALAPPPPSSRLLP